MVRLYRLLYYYVMFPLALLYQIERYVLRLYWRELKILTGINKNLKTTLFGMLFYCLVQNFCRSFV